MRKDLYLSGNGHADNLTQSGIVEPEETRDLAGSDVTATFGHHANSTLGIRRLELVDVVNKGWVRSDFKVANHGIPLMEWNSLVFPNF